MQEVSRFAVGLDVGTTMVKVVVGQITDQSEKPTIIGVGIEPNSGMRKGTVVNLVSTAQAIDKALEAAERMCGHQLHSVSVSINGSHVIGMSSKGVIAAGHEITPADLDRAEEAATVLQLPANREILEVTPRSYQLDGQDNIKDPVGMNGVRLEVNAHVITALTPHVRNLEKACEMTETRVNSRVLSGLAAARAVVTEQQMENGVVLVDIGGTTTNVIVYEEGDLQHVAVLPLGSVNITNDLAIGLKTDLDIAEMVKVGHAVAAQSAHKNASKKAIVKLEKATHEFDIAEIDMIVEARLEEIFEAVDKELKSIGRSSKLPGGVVLTGGGSLLPGIDEYAKQALRLSARVAKPTGYDGVSDDIQTPAFATVIGLMLSDIDASGAGSSRTGAGQRGKVSSDFIGSLSSKITGVFGKFRS